MSKKWNGIPKTGMYDPEQDHDSCGVGLVANIDGKKEHAIIEKALSVIGNLVHRGALGGDLKTGDGAGLIFQTPHEFFKKVTPLSKIKLPDNGKYGAGMIFLSQDNKKRNTGIEILKSAAEETGGKWLGIRDVPTDPSCLGEIALSGMPQMIQIFVSFNGIQGDDLERKLYLMRKIAENNAIKKDMNHIDFYICSLSSRTINYKGLLLSQQVKQFFPDLSDKDFKSGLAVVHQRYSTNTFPTWPLAQPFRFIAHNGEINTLRGNINKMRARESSMTSPLFGDDLKKLFPIIDPEGSDSGMFDNSFELLVNSGRSMEHSMMMMVPEAFGVKYHISQDKRSFYEYHANFMEPWDGPSALVFTDGIRIGATLDRNGLRPCRYTITKDGFVYLASECGVIDIPAENIQKKGRLQPGKIFMIDTEQSRILEDNEIKAKVSRKKPYRHWISKNRIELKGLFSAPSSTTPDKDTILQRQKLFGYTNEDLDMILEPMAINGQEPTTSMGKDVSLPILSKKPQLMFNYFKQLFAQVTNPPIDPIREGLVMSLMSFIGKEQNLLDETPKHCERLKLLHPILTNEDFNKIKTNTRETLKTVVIPSVFQANGKKDSLKNALEEMFIKASDAIKDGASVIILSDRTSDETHAPIPILLASAGLHHHLIRSGQRNLASIIVETGEAREVNHFALLTGYGVNAINPYLAFESLIVMKEKNILPEQIDIESAIDKYITSIKKGLLKVFSKMGISTLRSYNSAQIFEAIGVSKSVIDKYFTNTPSRIEGIDLDGIEKETLERHRKAFIKNNIVNMLDIGGTHRVRVKTENHLWNPFTIKMIQKAVRDNDYNAYKEFSNYINSQSEHLCTIRGLFKFKKSTSIPIEEVEPASEIAKRFVTGAMSFGSISREAHESMAVAMNKLGGKSNTGEGGEETVRFKPRPDGTSARSAIKQIASGRFGVTTEYLVNSDEMQIKMAQGAKPGEGGQLPGFKVDKTIASVRHSTPGVTLISPPPHHDIYSIEDLAQLIYDLRNVNRSGRVSVKLVSEIGVGTVAAGVAKAKADMVLVSGHDGGTGASPRSSILSAGIPWEIGVAETQHTLVANKLRDKIRLQTDGQLKTGYDVVIASLLGAEEFGFATIVLITMGCIMMRKCHKNTCPVGIATQREELRNRFTGKPEHIVNYFLFVAEEIREIMAELGFRTMDEMTGQVDKIDADKAINHWKANGLDLSLILSKDHIKKDTPLRCTVGQIHDWSLWLDKELIEKCKPAIENREKVSFTIPVKNMFRTIGASLSGEIAKKYGYAGLDENTIDITFKGTSGQSFGAFLSNGMSFRLEGEANDYLGKGMSGGRIVVVPPEGATFIPENNIIVGNTLLYGATNGEVFIRGVAGERFCVRNSGAHAVVEGVGDHACEYMTGGVVVVLGNSGRNFAAGMSGGIAYVLDKTQLFDTLCNLDMVDIEPVTDEEDISQLKELIEKHIKYTDSSVAKQIIDNWKEMLPQFVKVMPMDYKHALMAQRLEEERDTDTVPVTEEVFEKIG